MAESHRDNNRTFIARATNDVAWLLEAVERLRREKPRVAVGIRACASAVSSGRGRVNQFRNSVV